MGFRVRIWLEHDRSNLSVLYEPSSRDRDQPSILRGSSPTVALSLLLLFFAFTLAQNKRVVEMRDLCNQGMRIDNRHGNFLSHWVILNTGYGIVNRSPRTAKAVVGIGVSGVRGLPRRKWLDVSTPGVSQWRGFKLYEVRDGLDHLHARRARLSPTFQIPRASGKTYRIIY